MIRVDVAHAVKADGVHLGQSDLKVAEARAILGQAGDHWTFCRDNRTSDSCWQMRIDYLAASPVFLTKKRVCTSLGA